jgi:hypothetical protein
MRRYLPAFLFVLLAADWVAHATLVAVPDLATTLLYGFVFFLAGGLPPLIVGRRELSLDGWRHPRLFVALAIAAALGLGGFLATRTFLAGQEELVVRITAYVLVVHASVRLADAVPMDAPELDTVDGRYWGRPWDDADTVEARGED